MFQSANSATAYCRLNCVTCRPMQTPRNIKEMHSAFLVVVPFQPLKTITESQMTEGKMAMFVAGHTAVATCDHLNNLFKGSFTDSRIASMIQMKRTKCSAIIKNVLYPHIMNEITSAVGNNHYSLLIDESTDISVHKYLGMAIIYYDEVKEKVISTFLSLSELSECTADAIVTFWLKSEKSDRHRN